MRHPDSQQVPTRNHFNLPEFNGAFGDLGTLLPFIMAYIGIVGVPAGGLLISFGLAFVVVGLKFKTPFPVQPMKAIATVASGHAAIEAGVDPTVVSIAAIFTGLIWLGLSVGSLAKRVAELVPPDALLGVVMGLGFVFMLEGVNFMNAAPIESIPLFVLTFVLLQRTKWPVMLLLIFTGMTLAVVKNPALIDDLLLIKPSFSAPMLVIPEMNLHSFGLALGLLVLPQLPLTFGNAYLAVIDENNRHFPDRPICGQSVARSTGLMNLMSGLVGGVPMCHGAGGMAGHMAFGARTGGASVILGICLLILGLWFEDSVMNIFELFPASVLGVALFLAGLSLAMGSRSKAGEKSNRALVLLTAGFTLWNVGLAVVLAFLVHWATRKGWIKF